MASNGFQFYFDESGLGLENLSIYNSFNNTSSGTLLNEYGENPSSIFIEGYSPSFSSKSGCGNFSGDSVYGVVDRGFNKNDIFNTTTLIYQKDYSGGAVLISTLDGSGVDKRGYEFGLDDSDGFYISSPNQNGDFLHLRFQNIKASRHGLIYLSKDGQDFSLGRYNVDTKEYEVDSVSFSSDFNVDSDKMFLASNPNPDLVLNKKFSGFLDEFVCYSSTIESNKQSDISNGFFRDNPTELSNELIYDHLDNFGDLIDSNIQINVVGDYLDEVASNVFQFSGMGSVEILSEGYIQNGIGYISGFISGDVIMPDPDQYFTVVKKLVSFDEEIRVPLESGIVGYTEFYDTTPALNPNISDSGSVDVLGVRVMSPVYGVTKWGVEYINPVYQETILEGGTVFGESELYFREFNYSISGGFSGYSRFSHKQRIASDGVGGFVSSHTLDYFNPAIQSSNVIITKTDEAHYENNYIEKDWDYDFSNSLMFDGVSAPYGDGVSELFTYKNTKLNQDSVYRKINNTVSLANEYKSGNPILFVDGKIKSSQSTLPENKATGDGVIFSLASSYITPAVFMDFLDRNDITFSEFNNSNLLSGKVIPSNEGDFIFVNGLKLIKGEDYYYESGSSILIKEINSPSDIIVIPNQQYVDRNVSDSGNIKKAIENGSIQPFKAGYRLGLDEFHVFNSNQSISNLGSIDLSNTTNIIL